MKRIALCLPAVLLLSVTLLACGAAPASVSPVQNSATAAPAVPTPPTATLPPQPALATDVAVVPSAAPATPTVATAAQVGQPFQLALGQAVQVAGTNLTLTFADVTEDSRCPRGVDCAWSGQVIVVLDATQGGRSLDPVPLTIEGTGHQVAKSRALVGGYTVLIVDVEPYPEISSAIAPGDYVVTLRVE